MRIRGLMITGVFLLCLLIVSAQESNTYNNCEIYGNCEPVAAWLTKSLGILIDANDSQFFSNEGILNILESYIDSQWCRLTGCTMEGNIDMGGNNITNVDFAEFADVNITNSLFVDGDITVSPGNQILMPNPTSNNAPSYSFIDQPTSGFSKRRTGGGLDRLHFIVSGNIVAEFSTTGYTVNGDSGMRWATGSSDPTGTIGASFYKDADWTISQKAKSQSNAQELRIYNTDTSNKEFLSLGFINNADVFTIETEKTNAGIVRDIALMGGNVGIGTTSPGAKLDVNGSGNFEEDLNVTGNIIGSGKLIMGIPNISLCNEVAEGGICINGQSTFNASVAILSNPTGFAFAVSNDRSQTRLFDRLNFQTTYEEENRLFCDPAEGNFNVSAVGEGIFILASTPNFAGAIFEIIGIVNTTCVTVIQLGLGTGTPATDFTNGAYLQTSFPIFSVFNGKEGGAGLFRIGENEDEEFRIVANNATGPDNFVVKVIASVDDIFNTIIDSDSNGQRNLVNLLSLMESEEEVTGSVLTNMIISADLSNHIEGDYTGLKIDLLNTGTNVSKTAIEIDSGFGTLLESSEDIDLERVYYDNTSTTTDITNQVNDSTTSTTLFDVNGSILYLGNEENFTKITFAVENESSDNVDLIFFYCNSSSGWQELNASDNTAGLTHSGTIEFTNPLNRGTCNKELDDTPFADTTNHTYIAIQRTESLVSLPPTVRTVKSRKGSSKYVIGNNDELVGADFALGFINEEFVPEGAITQYFLSKNIDGEPLVNLAMQAGGNLSSGIFGNSFGLIPNYVGKDNFSTADGKINMTELTNYDLLCSTFEVDCSFNADTRGNAIDLITGGPLFFTFGDAEFWQSVKIHMGISVDESAIFNMEENDFEINNGSLHIATQVTFEKGFTAGDPVTKFIETFSSDLGIFTNLQTDLGDWNSVLNTVYCNEGQCAQGTGAGVGLVEMQTNISTLDINETTLSFIYSLVNLIGTGEFSIVVNNNVGSGDVEIFSDTTDSVIQSPESIALPASMDNQSLISITVICDIDSIAKPTRQCFIDTVKLNGTAITTTLINVSGFNSVMIFGDETILADGFPERGIVFNASGDITIMRGDVNINGTLSGGSPLKFGHEGITFLNSSKEPRFSIYQAEGFDYNVPPAFAHSLIFETDSINNENKMEVCFWDEETQLMLFCINQGAAQRATTVRRSLQVVGNITNKENDENYTLCEGTNFIDCDTDTTGADLFVEDDIESRGSIYSQENMTANYFIGEGSQLINVNETDPIYSAWDKDYDDLTNTPELQILGGKNLIGYWSGDGHPKDLSGYGNNGILRNDTSYGEGVFGQGFYFDGDRDYVEIGDKKMFDFDWAFTVSAWIKVEEAPNGYDSIVSKGGGTTKGWNLRLKDNLKPSIVTNSHYAESPNAISLNEWHNIVGTYNGTHLLLYVDGIFKASRNTSMNTLGGKMTIGSAYGNAQFYNRSIDEVKIYNRSLSADAIAGMYADGIKFKSSNNSIYFNGNVGIGTDSPQEKLHIAGDLFVEGDVTFNDTFFTASGSVGIGTPTPIQKLDIIGNVNITGNLTVSERVGIGTNNPDEKLHIYDGNIRIEDSDPTLYFTRSSDNDTFGFKYDESENDFHIVMENNGRDPSHLDDIMTFTPQFRVGIKNSNPTVELDVNGNTRLDGYLNVTGFIYGDGSQLTGITENVAFTNQNNIFGAFNQTFDTNTFFIDSIDNRIGIGTLDPREEVHINSTHPTITFEESDASSNEKVWEIGATAEEFIIKTANDLHTATQTAMRIGGRGGTSFGFVEFPHGEIIIDDLSGSWTGGSRYVCVFSNGTLFTSEGACP